MPAKRVRIGKTPPSEKAVTAEPANDEEAFQISEGKAGLIEVGERVTQYEEVVKVPKIYCLRRKVEKESTEQGWELRE